MHRGGKAMQRRRVCRALARLAWAGIGLAVAAPTALAQPYPVRPVRLVVPFAPGGAIDMMARSVGAQLVRELGQPVVIDNRAGAGGSIGADAVAKSAPDGYTLLTGTSATHGVNPALFAKLPFDARRDFIPVALWGSVPNVLVVHAASGIRTLEELIARARREPGRLTYGSAGNGTSLHLAGELFTRAAGVRIVHVPYKGGAPASTDLLGGQIDMMFDTVAVALPNIRAGRLVPLAVAARQRHFVLPEVPTFAERGLQGVEAGTWAGLFAPAGTPPSVIEALEKASARALQDAGVVERLRALGVQPQYTGSREFAAFVDAEITRWGELVKSTGVRAE